MESMPQDKNIMDPCSSTYMHDYYPDDEINLKELLLTLWKGKWIIILTTILFAVASVFYALSKPNIYKADALLAPAQSSDSSSLSKMAGQFGGLASLAGINLGGSSASKTQLAVEVMRSRQFVDAFIKKHNLLIPLMTSIDWDAVNNKLILNDELYNAESKKWLRKPKGLRKAKPSAQEAYAVFSKKVSIEQAKNTELYILSVKNHSPYIAQQWVTWLISDINNIMRERAIAESKQNIAYLEEQLQRTSVADMQATFYNLMEEQTKSLMLAEVQEEFVFKAIDPAVVPEVKSEPKRALICVVGTITGGVLGVFLVFILALFRQEKKCFTKV